MAVNLEKIDFNGDILDITTKVDKVTGKSLVSDTEITKLSGVSTGANKVEASTTNGNIKIDGTETKVYTEVANTVHDANYKHITVTGSSVSDGTNTFNKYSHPTKTAATAAAVKIGNDGLGHVVLGNALTKSDIGLGNVDNTSDANKPVSTATQTELNKKQATLVSGTNIKTINNESLLGSGNIELATTFEGTNGNIPVFKDGTLEDSTALPIYTGDGTVTDATEFVLPSQVATINGQSILEGGDVEIRGFSGDYNDLTNKPTFKTINNEDILGVGNIETKVKYTTCTLPAFTAAGSKAVTVSGVTADSTPILDVVTSTTAATAATQLDAWSHIYAATTSANTITFYSDGATTEITVAVKGY